MFHEIAGKLNDNGDGFQIDYDENLNSFRITYFSEYHYVDDMLFDKDSFNVEEDHDRVLRDAKEHQDDISMDKYIELWSDEEVIDMEKYVYTECCGKSCGQCFKRLEVDGKSCKAELITELYRKWQNASKNQIPVKPYYVTNKIAHCGMCGTVVKIGGDDGKFCDEYCDHCGQKIDWRD